MRTAESVLATGSSGVRRHLGSAGRLLLGLVGSTVHNASVIALVMLVSDALERGRRLIPPDAGNRLRWVMLASAVWALLALVDELFTRRKQGGSAVNAT